MGNLLRNSLLMYFLYLALRSGLGARTPQPEKQVLVVVPTGEENWMREAPTLKTKKQLAGRVSR
jgi:hypothetical protein